MLSDGNLSQYFQQGLNPSFMGLAGAPSLMGSGPQFSPQQGAFAQLGAYGGSGPPGLFGQGIGQGVGQGFGQELGQQFGQQNPAQQILGVLHQLAQQAVMQGIATHQIGAALHQLVQHIHYIQQVAAQSLQGRLGQGLGYGAGGQPFFGQGLPGLGQGQLGQGLQGLQGSGWAGGQGQQSPFGQGFFGQHPFASAGAGGYRPTMQ